MLYNAERCRGRYRPPPLGMETRSDTAPWMAPACSTHLCARHPVAVFRDLPWGRRSGGGVGRGGRVSWTRRLRAVGRLVARAGQPVLSRVSALVLLLVSGLVLPLATVLGLICFDERIGAPPPHALLASRTSVPACTSHPTSRRLQVDAGRQVVGRSDGHGGRTTRTGDGGRH